LRPRLAQNKRVAEVLGVARSNLIEQIKDRPRQRVGRPPAPADELIAEIKAVIADLPTYGYRRVHAILRRRALAEGRQPPNHKRVYRVMKEHGLLLQRHASGNERRHEGKIAVDRSDLRWCSDAFEVACENGERVRVVFALDCCDREAMSYVATTGGIGGEEVRDLMVAAVEHRFGPVSQLPRTIEWLTDNGSGYVSTETPPLCPRPRSGASDDPVREPAVERHGRGVRANHQARLCPRLPCPGRRNRDASASRLAGALQRNPPAQGAGLPFTSRVHRHPINPITLSCHSGATTCFCD
jgi:putative transposase